MKSVENFNTENSILSSVFYAPSIEAIFPFVDYYVKQDSSSIYNDGIDILSYIIKNHYVDYCTTDKLGIEYGGSINVKGIEECIKNCIFTINQLNYFKNPSFYMNMKEKKETIDLIKDTKCTLEDENIFAVGRLLEDYQDSDPDPYQTAGGYRNWIALKGTVCYFKLCTDNSISVVFDSNCIVDHYNNNFFGNSTGGGTTEYKVGERVEKRSFIYTTNVADILRDNKFLIKIWDLNKAKLLCQSNVNNKIQK